MKLTLAIAAAFATAAIASPAFAGPGEDLAAKEKCSKCHTEKTTKKAPSWASVAEKYKGQADAPEKIFQMLKKGGKVGDEDDHMKVTKGSDAEIKALAQVVLSSK